MNSTYISSTSCAAWQHVYFPKDNLGKGSGCVVLLTTTLHDQHGIAIQPLLKTVDCSSSSCATPQYKYPYLAGESRRPNATPSSKVV